MLKSKKHVFWEALLVTILIFLAGFFIGILTETKNSTEISDLYVNSEISLTDATATLQFLESKNIDCETIIQNNIEFADKIYGEAKLLEKYEEKQTITKNMDLLHKKYDLLRTLLWMNNENTLEKCNDYNLIVYLYEYDTELIEKQATQNVWSKILLEIKDSNEDVLLIPIAADQDLSSLNLLISKYSITQFPAIIVNDKQILYSLEDSDTLKSLLD